jgi:SAM-dependent methyltransferase
MSVNPISKEEWVECQSYEKQAWGDSIYLDNAYGELYKQNYYAECMGLIESRHDFNLDLKGKSVLDVGCGPVSMLLRARNFQNSAGVEPLQYHNDMIDVYSKYEITLYNIPAEEMVFKYKEFDEVWMYNVLQHVYNPYSILDKLTQYGKRVRLYEWIDIPSHLGHPHCLTEEMFVDKLQLTTGDYKIVHPTDPHLVGKAIVVNKIYE